VGRGGSRGCDRCEREPQSRRELRLHVRVGAKSVLVGCGRGWRARGRDHSR
jgi:hypothetical protein